jgi:hypothetical protein
MPSINIQHSIEPTFIPARCQYSIHRLSTKHLASGSNRGLSNQCAHQRCQCIVTRNAEVEGCGHGGGSVNHTPPPDTSDKEDVERRPPGGRRSQCHFLPPYVDASVNTKRQETESTIDDNNDDDDDTAGGGDSKMDCSFLMPPGGPCRGLYSPAVGNQDAERLFLLFGGDGGRYSHYFTPPPPTAQTSGA